MKFANPKNDIAFKKIFGNENKKEILISFLNSILDFKDNQIIVHIKLNNPYQLPDIKELKETILDIKATNKNKETFIIEMQKKNTGGFEKRSLYYTSKAYVSQIDKAEDFNKLKKVYYIALVDFNIFNNKSFISRHLIINQETARQDLKDFEFSFIELNKFNLKLSDCDSILKKWIYFINNTSSLDIIPKEFNNLKEFKSAFEIANKVTWNKKELEVYDYISLREADDINAMNFAALKAKNEGVKEGIEQGIEQNNTKVVIKSIKQGLDNKTISLITSLSIKQIQKIRLTI
jgi:predicted transposase/invertase (TIGR01784 family)